MTREELIDWCVTTTIEQRQKRGLTPVPSREALVAIYKCVSDEDLRTTRESILRALAIEEAGGDPIAAMGGIRIPP